MCNVILMEETQTKKEVLKFKAPYLARLMSIRDIANKLDISHTWVWMIFKERGIRARGWTQKVAQDMAEKKRKRELDRQNATKVHEIQKIRSQAKLDDIIGLMRQGVNTVTVAQKYGVKRVTVYAYLRRRGYGVREIKGNKANVYKNM